MLKTTLKGKPTDHCPICSSLEEKVTDQILGHLQKRTLPKGVTVFGQDCNSKGLYLLSKGSVKISRISPHGKEVILDILHPGQTFGENGLLGDFTNNDLITTNEDVEMFCLPQKDFQQILAEHPEIYKKVVTSLIQWVDRLHTIIENISTPSAKERVSGYLKRLTVEQSNSLIHLSGKKHEVALMLGLRPETFSRALTDLEQSGAIKMNHKQIQVLKAGLLA
ncbi:MAG: Crp/Fnr family transcriptional regulator [Pseudobdellovibrionaceae bacterium]